MITSLLIGVVAVLWASGLMAGLWRMRSARYGIRQPVPKDDPWRLWRYAVRDPWMWATIFLALLFYVFLWVMASTGRIG